MAGIQVAAHWMMNGKTVKRFIWGSDTEMFLDTDNVTVMVRTGSEVHPYQIPVIDLLADDWWVIR